MEETIKNAPTLYGSEYDPITGKTSYSATQNPVYKPVSFLSTENAADTVGKDLKTLNTISPTTAPGYVAPTPTEKPTPKVEPKAYFTNADGQEVEFTQTQYNDPTNQKFLQDNKYVQSKTEFNTNYKSAAQTAVSNLDSQIEGLTTEFTNYNVDTDPAYASKVKSIQGQFANLRVATEKANAGRATALSSLGLRTGTTQYAGGVQLGIEGEELTQATARMSEINRQEAETISSAREAFESKKWDTYSKKVTAIQNIRETKSKELDKINTLLADSIKKGEETKTDNEIANLYATGTTDIASILKTLKGKGISTSISKIASTLKDIIPAGLDDLVKTARSNGASPKIISKILSSGGDMNKAYKEAGSFGLGGTGMIGEYNYYKAQTESAGQVPLDFNEYQNADANRKIKIQQAANAAGLTSALTNTALKLSDDYEARSKDYYQQREAYNRIVSSATDPSAAGDLALIFNYMKVLDPGSTVREGEFANAQNAGSAFSIVGAKYNKIVSGERLTEVQRKDFVDRANKLFEGAKKQQDSVVKEFESKAVKYGVPGDLVVRDTSATGSITNDLIQTEKAAEDNLKNFITKNPTKETEIDDLIKKMEEVLARPVNAADFLQRYPQYK